MRTDESQEGVNPPSPPSPPSLPNPPTPPNPPSDLTTSLKPSTFSFTRQQVEHSLKSDRVIFDAYGTHGVLNSSISILDLKKSYELYRDMKETVHKKGGFNTTIIANSAIVPPEWMTSQAYSLDDGTKLTPNGFVFRVTSKQYDPELFPTQNELIEEVYLTLYASHMGVGPSVYAAAILTSGAPPARQQYGLYMVLSGGFDTGLKYNETKTPTLLYESCERASRAGLLLLDIKIPNTITVVSEVDHTSTVQMIDFGADFTLQLFDANYSNGDGMVSCLLYLNLFLLLSNIKCHTNFPSAIINDLFSRLQKLDTASILCNIIDSIYIPKRWELCSNYKYGCEEIELIKPNKTHVFGVTDQEEYKKLVVNYIYMIRWYVFEESCNRRPQLWKPSKDKTFMEQLGEWLSITAPKPRVDE